MPPVLTAPPGPAGGVELELVTIANATDTATATCPVGHLVVGGGASRTSTSDFLVSGYPSGAGTAWTAVWSGIQGNGTVHAICALTPVVKD